MATLPSLKSGQILQYPVVCTVEQNIDSVAFLDGTDQRWPVSRPLRRWRILLDLLDEQEMAALAAFVAAQSGQSGSFEFTDPTDGVTYSNCSLVLDQWTATSGAPGRQATEFTIRENVS